MPYVPKLQKNDRPKIPRFHADTKLLGIPKDSNCWSSKNTKIPRGSKLTWKSQRFKKVIVQRYQDPTRIQTYLENPKIKNMIVWKYQDSTRLQNYGKGSSVRQTFLFYLVGFTYVLGLFTIMQDLQRFHHRTISFF